MASGKQLMEQIYDQFLVCKICFEIYKRPKTLICLHIFCVDCLVKHQDAEYERTYRYSVYNTTVSCPICRKKTDLPTGGVRRLPDNFLVANLADVVTRRPPYSKYQECEICKADKYNVQRQAVSKCLDCAKHLCKICVELHRRTKVTKSHSLFDIEIGKEIECKDHPDETVRFYCEPCEQCICVVCTFQEHKGHDVSSFSEGMQKYQASLDKLVALCRDRIGHVKDQIGVISKCEGEIKNAEDEIRDMAIDSITDIRRKEREMVKNVYDAFGQEGITFLKEKQPLQENLATLQNTCNLTDVVIRDKNVELLLLKDEIQHKINKLLETQMVSPPASLSKQIKFIPGSVHFGQLSVDGEPCNGEISESIPALDIAVPTDNSDCKMNQVSFVDQETETEQVCETLESKLTQTCEVKLQERGTSPIAAPVAKIRSRGVMTDANSIQMHEKQTNTSVVATTKRKTQTDRRLAIEHAKSNTSSSNVDKGSNTKLYETCEMGTTTDTIENRGAMTDTLGLVVYENKGCLTPLCYIKTSTSSTMTDKANTKNMATVTVTQPKSDKGIMTSKVALINNSTSTQKWPSKNFAQNTDIEGVDKFIHASNVATCHVGIGDSDVRSCDGSINTSCVNSRDIAINTPQLWLKDSKSSSRSVGKRNDNMEPVAKKARLENVSSQTEIKLYDMDRLWQMLNTTMCTTATNTESDANIIIKPQVATTDAGMVTDLVLFHNEPVKRVTTQDTSTTMNTNVLKVIKKKVKKSMTTSLRDIVDEPQNSSMKVDDACLNPELVKNSGSENLPEINRPLTVESVTTMDTDVKESCLLNSDIIYRNNSGESGYCSELQAATGTPKKVVNYTTTSTTTDHNVHVCNQVTNTVTKSYLEKNCGTSTPEMKDKKTSTFIERRNVAIMKRPHCVSRGVITPKVCTNEQMTSTETTHFRDAMLSTDVTSMSTTGCDPILQPVDVKCVGTERVTVQNSCTTPVAILREERASSPIRLPVMTNRECSPIKFSVCSKAISVSPNCQERSVETIPPATRDTFTMMPITKHVHRKTSPIRDFKSSVNQATTTRHVTYATRSLSPIRGLGRAKGTMTSVPVSVNRGSSPVRISGHDKIIMAKPEVTSTETETVPKRTSDVCVSTLNIPVVDKGTGMVKKYYSEKETLTTIIHSINKMVGTETTRCVDAFTTMATDIASAYKEVITPKPIQTCSRGTSTKSVKFAAKQTSPERPYSSDRASSPVKFETFDKGITANKAQLLEPSDMYQSVGMITMPFRPVGDNPKSELESIEELAESDEEHATKEIQTETPPRSPRPHFGRRAISATDIRCGIFDAVPRSPLGYTPFLRSPTSVTSRFRSGFQGTNVHTEHFTAIAPRLGQSKAMSESMFNFNGNAIKSFSPPTEILCTVEMATNTCDKDMESKQTSTPPIEMEDKCVCTESLQVGTGKMAECISKLKTVRQRLENQPVYVQAAMDQTVTASSNTTKTGSNSFSDVTSVRSQSDTHAGGHTENTKEIDYPKAFLADKVDTTLLIRSKSVEKVMPQSDIVLAPFLSPQLSRKTHPADTSEDTDKDVTTKRALARKKRPLIEQLLGRSESLPEQECFVKPNSKPHSKSLNLALKPTQLGSNQHVRSMGAHKSTKVPSAVPLKSSPETTKKRSPKMMRSNVPLPENRQNIGKHATEKKTKTASLVKRFLEPTVASRASAVNTTLNIKPGIAGRVKAIFRTELVKDLEMSSESSN